MRMLFLSPAGSARGPIAAAFATSLFGVEAGIECAGLALRPLHPIAVQVMGEIGLDLSRQVVRRADEISPADFDLVVMIGEEDLTPAYLKGVRHVHWRVADPAAAASDLRNGAAALRAFRDARITIAQSLKRLL